MKFFFYNPEAWPKFEIDPDFYLSLMPVCWKEFQSKLKVLCKKQYFDL